MKHILGWSLFVLIAKTLRDTSEWHWTSSWLSDIPFFVWWHNLPGAINIWHMCDGAIIVSAAGFMIYQDLKNEGIISDRFKNPGKWIYWIGMVVIWYLVFYALFNICFHVLFLRFWL